MTARGRWATAGDPAPLPAKQRPSAGGAAPRAPRRGEAAPGGRPWRHPSDILSAPPPGEHAPAPASAPPDRASCRGGDPPEPPRWRGFQWAIQRHRTRTSLLLLLCLVAALLPACESGTGGELGPDAASGDAPSPEAAGPPPASEVQLTSSPQDELFPDVGEDAIVFVRPVRHDAAPEIDCMQCFGCGGCAWQMVLLRPSTGVETVLAEEVAPGSSPHVSGTLVYWLRSYSSEVTFHDLQSGTNRTVSVSAWTYMTAAPVLRNGRMYWYGYAYGTNQNGLLSAPIDGPSAAPALEVSGYFQETYNDMGGALATFARTQPFAMDDEHVAWAEWNNLEQRIDVRLHTLATGETVTLSAGPGRDSLSPALGGGFVAWKSYDRQLGCGGATCVLTLHARTPSGEILLLTDDDARPSRYARPSFMGAELLWMDYRGGPYELFARDLSRLEQPEQRVTSDQAVLGSTTAPAISGRRLVWMDHRAGSWDLWQKDL